jgi:hypothetical protein
MKWRRKWCEVKWETVINMCVIFSLEKLTDRTVGAVGSVILKCIVPEM